MNQPPLNPKSLATIQAEIARLGADGWLLYNFRNVNPVAAGLIGIEGLASRRTFTLIPREGKPVAITHAIEQGAWERWPSDWTKEVYSSWRSLEAFLKQYVNGKTLAMEYSPGDAVPYLDRIPAGVLEMIRAAGAKVVTSGELVSRFFAVWTPEQIASHERAAVEIARIAREAFGVAAERVRSGKGITEYELQEWIRGEFAKAGLETDHGPNVSTQKNAANPHYEPTAESSASLRDGELVLIDLWAKEPDGIYADQTWVASLGKPNEEQVRVFEAVRDARDAALDLITKRVAAGEPVRGAEADDAARKVIEDRGYGQYFVHRTGHSIDARELHGSGPHLDNLESREERLLIPGVGFSVEPGIYIPGKIGVRSEVNVYLEPGRAVVTPAEYQHELWVF